MKCPNCKTKIGVFSKSANKWGKIKTCDKCRKPYRVKVNYGIFFGVTISLGLIASFALQGGPKNIVIGLIAGVAVMLSLEAVSV